MTLTSDSLVSTKLGPSQARPKLVARPQLTAKLEREAGRKLTLISAPAGFGKTTLLVEWLRERAVGEESVAWLTLDEGDNDPTRFLSYLIAALRSVEEEIGQGVLSALRSPEPPRMEVITAVLINELAALSGELTLVLDDYHAIDSEHVHEVVSFLLEYLPPNVHLIISSRIDPPLPLARLRARNEMLELDAAELSFTSEEAATFLNSVMELDLSAEDVAALEERTEGWIAGLQLAALSMRDRKDFSGFINAFSGSHRDVFDYLAEEVLERQPQRVREFLLQTCVLDHLSDALCNALTGCSDGRAMLEGLENNNLFVVALDDQRVWYRYHHLFADFLRGHLKRERPERVNELHLRAASWYEQNGWAPEAVGHALAAEDYERAADLVERAVAENWSRGEIITLLGWLRALPEEAIRCQPRLSIEYALALLFTGQLEGVEHLFEEAERAASKPTVAEDRRRYLLGYASAVRSWRAHLLGDPHDALELARRALSLLPEDPTSRTFAASCLGKALWATGDLVAASEAYAQSAEFGRAAGYILGMLSSMANQALVQMERGRLHAAAGIVQEALGLATEQGAESLPAAGLIRMVAGVIYYQHNDLDRAERELTKCIELAERTGEVVALVREHVYLSQVKQARGDYSGALETALKADAIARSFGAIQTIAMAGAWMARLHMAQGNLSEATRWGRERMVETDVAVGGAWMVEKIAQAQLLHLQDRHGEALLLLERLQEEAEEDGRMGSAIEILALQALVLRATGEKAKAMSTLARSLSLAEPEGYVRTFVDEGPPMAKLLSEVLEARQSGRLGSPSPSAHFLRKLLAALEQDASGTAPPGAELPEPLSERELEVLILIAAGKSNRQIAKELFVTAGTIKAHIRNIYRKLEAHSRTQALARARELNLL